MPKALIHCFSGTGNTRLAADLLASELAKLGFEMSVHDVVNGTCAAGGSIDLHLFCFPIYATAVPHIMARYLRRLPDGQNTKAAVLSTNGRISTRIRDGHQGWALHEARLILVRRHYEVFFSDTFDLPHNMTIIGPPRQQKYNRIIVDMAEQKIMKAAAAIAYGQRSHRRCFFLHFFWSIPFGLLFSLAGRRALGKLLVAGRRCTACGLCVACCPAGNIRRVGSRLWFGWRCEGCLRCVNLCPKPSIQLSLLRLGAMIFALTWNPLSAFGVAKQGFLNGMLGEFGGMFVEFLIALVFATVVFCLLDAVIFLLGYIPFLKQIAGWGHTALFGRYNSGIKPLSKE